MILDVPHWGPMGVPTVVSWVVLDIPSGVPRGSLSNANWGAMGGSGRPPMGSHRCSERGVPWMFLDVPHWGPSTLMGTPRTFPMGSHRCPWTSPNGVHGVRCNLSGVPRVSPSVPTGVPADPCGCRIPARCPPGRFGCVRFWGGGGGDGANSGSAAGRPSATDGSEWFWGSPSCRGRPPEGRKSRWSAPRRAPRGAGGSHSSQFRYLGGEM